MKKHPTAVRFVLALVAVLVAILLGCGGPVKYPNYYTLHLPPPPDPPVAENVHATLAVREFRSPTYLRQGAIVYKTSPEQIGFYNYHRWAVDPRAFVTNAVDRKLACRRQLQLGEAIRRTRPTSITSLAGVSTSLTKSTTKVASKVRVSISAQMVNAVTGATVWSNSVSEVGTVGQRDVPAVVAAMNGAMGRAIEKLLTPAPAPALIPATMSKATVQPSAPPN